MKVLSCGSYKGCRNYNGDIYNQQENLYYVMDGSTALFNDFKFFETGDLYEYMQLLKKNFHNRSTIVEDLKTAVNLSNAHLVGMENYEEYELPTYTIAVVKENEKDIETYILCDTLISILYKDGHVENIEDRRIEAVKEVCRKNRRAIMENTQITEEERKRQILLNEQVTRMKANQVDGYPVGSTVPERIALGYQKKIDKRLIDRILICSDGYYDSEEDHPSSKEEFSISYIENRVSTLLKEEKRDDLTYLLLEV